MKYIITVFDIEKDDFISFYGPWKNLDYVNKLEDRLNYKQNKYSYTVERLGKAKVLEDK